MMENKGITGIEQTYTDKETNVKIYVKIDVHYPAGYNIDPVLNLAADRAIDLILDEGIIEE